MFVCFFISEMKKPPHKDKEAQQLGKSGAPLTQSLEPELGGSNSDSGTNKTVESVGDDEIKAEEIKDGNDKQTLQKVVICDKCKRNLNECGCEKAVVNRDQEVLDKSQNKVMKSEVKTSEDQVSAEGTSDLDTKSHSDNVKDSKMEHDKQQNIQGTKSSTEPNDDKSTPSDGPQSDKSSANNLSENVTLSSIKKLVSQVSEKIAAENQFSAQKLKSVGNGAGPMDSCGRNNLQTCPVDGFVNHTESIAEKRLFLNSHENGLDNIRDSGNLQQLLLSNMLKLTSPPNQQVFPNSLPAIPVQGMARAYQHGAFPNPRPILNQLPTVHNVPRFVIPNPDIGQAIGNGICNYNSQKLSNITHYPWMDRKSKSKKIKSEKEKQIQNMFESESPPPNVDVSKLKDKGHGPIPRQKIASFMENPAEFMEQQTALVNKSISATSPNPIELEEDITEVCEPIKRSESVDSDRLSAEERADFVNSVQVPSPDKSIIEKDNNSNEDISTDISESTLKQDENTVATTNGKEESVPTTTTESIKGEVKTTTDVALHKVVASVPHTPTAIVHHPPNVSKTASTKAPTSAEDNEKCDADAKSDNKLSLAALLGHKNANQQVFPNVVQEAFLHNIGVSNPNLLQNAVHNSATQGNVPDSASVSTPVIVNTHTDSPRKTLNLRNYMGRQVQQTSIRQILENQNTNEFPASNLLSAAARAQLLQQQNQMSMILAQQLNGQIGNPFINPQINPSLQSLQNPVNVNTPMTNQLVAADVPAAVINLDKVEKTTNKVDIKFQSASNSTPKISELLSQSNSIVKKSNEVSVENSNVTEKKILSPNTGINGTGQQLQVQEESVNTQNNNIHVANNSMNQQLLNQQQLMQMCNAFGLPFLQTGLTNMKGNDNDSNSLHRQLQNQPTVMGEKVTTSQVQLSNQFVSPSTVSPNNAPGNMSLGRSQGNPPFQGPLMQNPNILYPNNLHGLNMLGTSVNPNGNPPIQSEMNVHMPEQQNSSSESSLIVMQNGIPMIQMLAPAQISIGSNVNNPSLPQLTLSNHGVGIQNLVQNGNNNACQPVLPLNLINVQQSWNNGNNNLTAMQLQTLQLQQQLLQQIQQVQGMQSLINHFNIQGLSNNIASTPVASSAQVSLSSVLSTVVNSSTSVLSSNTPCKVSERRTTLSAVSEAPPDVSSCVITSTVKRSQPESVSTTSSISESQENVSSTKVAITAADTTQESPVQCKTVTTRTVDIGTETEAFDEDTDDYDDANEDDDDDDDDDDDSSNGEETHEDTESYDEDTEVSEKNDEVDDSETESEHEYETHFKETPTKTAKQMAVATSPSKIGSPKSCYSLAIESVTAQRKKQEAESMRTSRKRYFPSVGDFTTVKSESPDKRLKLVIRKRTGLSPIKDDESPRKRRIPFEKETVDKSQRSEKLYDTSIKVTSHSDEQKDARLKSHKKKTLSESIKNLYPSKDRMEIDKKDIEKPFLTNRKFASKLPKLRSDVVQNKITGCVSFQNRSKSCDQKNINTAETMVYDAERMMQDCDSSSVNDNSESKCGPFGKIVTLADENEPTTTATGTTETDMSNKKDKKPNELTSKIAAALTSQKGRWHLLCSPKKQKPAPTETLMVKAHTIDEIGKKARDLQDFETVEGIRLKKSLTQN